MLYPTPQTAKQQAKQTMDTQTMQEITDLAQAITDYVKDSSAKMAEWDEEENGKIAAENMRQMNVQYATQPKDIVETVDSFVKGRLAHYKEQVVITDELAEDIAFAECQEYEKMPLNDAVEKHKRNYVRNTLNHNEYTADEPGYIAKRKAITANLDREMDKAEVFEKQIEDEFYTVDNMEAVLREKEDEALAEVVRKYFAAGNELRQHMTKIKGKLWEAEWHMRSIVPEAQRRIADLEDSEHFDGFNTFYEDKKEDDGYDLYVARDKEAHIMSKPLWFN